MVCGRTTRGDPVYFPAASFRGRIIYFCTESCLGAFRADPDRFYAAHRKPHGECDLAAPLPGEREEK